MSSLHQQFLDLFNELDHLLRQRLEKDKSVSHSALLATYAKQDRYFKQFESSLHVYKSLRNVLVHGTLPDQELPVAIPNQRVVEDYQKVIAHLRHPKTALETVAIRDVYSVAWEDSVMDHLKIMMQRGFRLAPIVIDSKIEGMFTESTIAQALVADGELQLTADSKFRHFEKLCSFAQNNRISGVEFADRTVTLLQVESIFQKNFEQGLFTSVVCITENGGAGEKLLGIVTAHDLPGASGMQNSF